MQIQQQKMRTFTVLDRSPEIIPGVFDDAGDGLVKFKVPQSRVDVWRNFMRTNVHEFVSDQFRNTMGYNMWGGGACAGKFAGDTGEAESFAIGQLTYLEQKALARWYTPRRYQEILGACISYEAGPWAKSINYKIEDMVGVGQRIAPNTSNIPEVDVAYALKNIAVEFGGLAYSYTVEDLVTSAYLGQPLPESKQRAAVEAYYNHMNTVALLGEVQFQGFYKNSNVTAANRASGSVWDAATPSTIISDVNVARSAYLTATQGHDEPRMMIVPLSTSIVLDQPMATANASNVSIKTYIEQNYKLKVMTDYLLETAASGSAKRVVFSNPTPDNNILHIPQSIVFRPPQFSDLKIMVPAYYKYAGHEQRRIQTTRYMDAV